ncbi:hypothetical protein [Bacteroides sp.]|uniref:hypothetical protein n=1 Tax=Bacteroides sp. TaxID=29523 RepID=UPI0026130312|nr:hypothetical protein [Bacteroides sp.]MDD3039608.1 hypothetical protein [Bacteroides sp.]
MQQKLTNIRQKNQDEVLAEIKTILTAINTTFAGILAEASEMSNLGTGVGVYDSTTEAGVVQLRSVGGATPITIALSGSTISVSLDQSGIDHTELANVGTLSHADLELSVAGKEDSFTKNTAFNKDFGSSVGTVCEGNDGRLPPTVSEASGSFLRDDNTWATVSTTKYETLMYELSGEVAIGCLGHYMSERTQSVANCRVGVLTAPSGSSIYIDIRKNTAAASGSILVSPIELAPTLNEVPHRDFFECHNSPVLNPGSLILLVVSICNNLISNESIINCNRISECAVIPNL